MENSAHSFTEGSNFMETPETKQPDKPDFEKLSKEVLPNTITEEGFRLFVCGCNSAWTYHAFPIIRERDALQKENERLKEEKELLKKIRTTLTEMNKKLMDDLCSKNELLASKDAELAEWRRKVDEIEKEHREAWNKVAELRGALKDKIKIAIRMAREEAPHLSTEYRYGVNEIIESLLKQEPK